MYNIQLKSRELVDQKYIFWSVLVEFIKNKFIAQRFSYDDIKKRFLMVIFNPDESK
jgi:hypothetical protein